MRRLILPEDPEDRLKMFKFMILKVDEAISSVPKVKEEIRFRLSKSVDIETSLQLHKKEKMLRMQELSLYDQRDRLEKKIMDMEKLNAV